MTGFDAIYGQESLKDYLKKSLIRREFSHAYLLSGERGMGKKTLARVFAQTVLCEAGKTEPCGTCHSCLQFLSGNHPDYVEVTHEKASLSVDDIRAQVVDPMLIRPYQSEYKIYLVDEAERMTVQAQNALLKTMEEPPEYGMILLLADNPAGFLQTVRSRSTMLRMEPLSEEVIVRDLMAAGAEQSVAVEAAAYARGNLGKAKEYLATTEIAERNRQLLSWLKAVPSMSFPEILSVVREMKERKWDNEQTLDFIRDWLRDLAVLSAGGDETLLIFPEQAEEMRQLGGKISLLGILKDEEAVEEGFSRLASNVGFEHTMELLLLAIKENR